MDNVTESTLSGVSSNIASFIEQCCLQHIAAGLNSAVRLRPYQKNLLHEMVTHPKLLVKKFRSAGATTTMLGWMVWRLFNKRRDEMLFLTPFSEIKKFVESLPLNMQYQLEVGHNYIKHKENGSSITMEWPVDSSDARDLRCARGRFDLIIIDEATILSHMHDVWQFMKWQIDFGAEIKVISTPCGNANWFYETWHDESAKFKRFDCNPEVDDAEWRIHRLLESTMSTKMFTEEILGQFWTGYNALTLPNRESVASYEQLKKKLELGGLKIEDVEPDLKLLHHDLTPEISFPATSNWTTLNRREEYHPCDEPIVAEPYTFSECRDQTQQQQVLLRLMTEIGDLHHSWSPESPKCPELVELIKMAEEMWPCEKILSPKLKLLAPCIRLAYLEDCKVDSDESLQMVFDYQCLVLANLMEKSELLTIISEIDRDPREDIIKQVLLLMSNNNIDLLFKNNHLFFNGCQTTVEEKPLLTIHEGVRLGTTDQNATEIVASLVADKLKPLFGV